MGKRSPERLIIIAQSNGEASGSVESECLVARQLQESCCNQLPPRDARQGWQDAALAQQ